MVFNAGGTTIKHIYITRLVKMKMVIPPFSEQQAISDDVLRTKSAFEGTIHKIEREIDLLREYRTRLVADVVTGKLDVREAAARIPEESTADIIDEPTDWSDETETADEEIAA